MGSGIVSNTRNNYKDRKNFIESLNKYQGKTRVILPDNFEKKISDWFKSNNLLICSQIRKLPYNIDNRTKGQYNKSLMLEALKKCRFVDFYSNIDYICNKLWHWKLSDINHLTDNILKYYDESQKIFQKIKNDRK